MDKVGVVVNTYTEVRHERKSRISLNKKVMKKRFECMNKNHFDVHWI